MKIKLIFNGYLAKQLLQSGNPIVDLQKDYKRNNAVIFVFEETDKFIEDLKRLTSKS